MSTPTTLLPFQPATMSTAQLAAVSFLAHYSARTHHLYAYQLRGEYLSADRFGGGVRPNAALRPESDPRGRAPLCRT